MEPQMLPTVIEVNGAEYDLRKATVDDVAGVVALLADDVLGATREGSDLAPYLAAFHEIDQDPNQCLLVAHDLKAALVGTMQLTVIPGLSRGATKRLQIEAVRLASNVRGGGLGGAFFEWAHAYGRSRGATLVQLTSDKARTDALRFYRGLGYEATHEGFKRHL